MGLKGSAGESEFRNEWEVGEFLWELRSLRTSGLYQEEPEEGQKQE